MPEVLDAATIQALLAKQKTRGEYDEELADFIQSGVAGVEISLIEGRFAGKKASNVKTGFDNARTRTNKQTNQPVHAGGNMVSVIKVGDAEKGEEEHVYLINKAVSADEADES